ncbi:MAG: tail fiber domain-containing protein [Deltaproteobacteria bacterium]|nr:tail fiber domain-containing protein [Deltaproteobacteria bacterium]
MATGYKPRGDGTQRPLTPEEEEANRRAVADAQAAQARANAGNTPGADGMRDGANFKLGQDAQLKHDAFQNKADEIAAGAGGRPFTVDELMAHNSARNAATGALEEEQARRAGVEVSDAIAPAGGIPGAFGGVQVVKHYTSGRSDDTTTDANKAMIGERLAQLDQRQPLTMGTSWMNTEGRMDAAQLDQRGANQFRGSQQQLAEALMAQSAGRGPSAAEGMMRAGANTGNQMAIALAKSGRGNQSVAMQAAQNAAVQNAQQTGAQASAVRAQEIQNARQQLGAVLAGARGQDLDAASQNAQLAQQASATNAGFVHDRLKTNVGLSQDAMKTNLLAGVDQRKSADEQISALMAQGMSLDAAKRQYELQQSQFNAELLARQAAADKGVAMAASQTGTQLLGAGISAVGALGAAAMSDRRLKKNVADAGEHMDDFLEALVAKTFDYKDEKHGEGRRIGIMAQDAERTPVGRMLVIDTPEGKAIDIKQAIGAALAGLAHMHKRVGSLERDDDGDDDEPAERKAVRAELGHAIARRQSTGRASRV